LVKKWNRMNKKILLEISRVREIMGFGDSLLLEQGRILSDLIARIGKKVVKNADDWFPALRDVLKDDEVYKKFNGKGIPVERIMNDGELMDVVEFVLSKQNAVTLKTKGALGPQLREVGFDISDDAALILGRGWTNNNSLADILDDVVSTTTKKVVKELPTINVEKIFSKRGAKQTDDILPLTEVLEEVMDDVGFGKVNMEDLTEFFETINIPTDDIDRYIKALFKDGKDISGIADIKKIFAATLGNGNYSREVIEALAKSDAWQNYVVKYGWTIENVADLLGRGAKEPIVLNFFKTLAEAKWFKMWLKGSAKNILWGSTAKSIYKWLGIMGLSGTLMNLVFGKKYLGKGKQKEALSPQMYMDIMTNKEMVVREGGWTDEIAKESAKKIKAALEGLDAVIPGSDSYGGVNDEAIENVYVSVPTILASSQLTHFYENLDGVKGTLKTALEGMQFSSFVSQNISNAFGDTTIADILDELQTKKWCKTCVTKGSAKAYETKVQGAWPRYRAELADTSGSNEVPYFSRLKGPIDVAVLGVLLGKCDPATNQDMEDCLNNMSPLTFNEAWATEHPEGVKSVDPYSANYDPKDVKDKTSEWASGFREIIGGELKGEEGESAFDKIFNVDIK